jgi:hypothetical protein
LARVVFICRLKRGLSLGELSSRNLAVVRETTAFDVMRHV